jgi:neutral trehalase
MAAQTDEHVIREKDYRDCVKYIQRYWKKITCTYPKDQFTHLGLPNPFVSPNDSIYKNDQFYWDSYFIILGWCVAGRKTWRAEWSITFFLFKSVFILSRCETVSITWEVPRFLS